MNVVIIGSGNVATVLGRKIKESGHNILQVISRNNEHAASLAAILGTAHGDYHSAIDKTADIYLFALSDTALFDVEKHFSLGKALAVHTAGSVSRDIFQQVSLNHGVLYPVQSMRREMTLIPEIPFLYDANNAISLNLLRTFALTLSDIVEIAGDDQRARLHTAAVVVSNFINHLYSLTNDFCEKEGVDFKLLQPLIDETALRLRQYSPKDLQTGPAIRNDVVTLQKHLQILSAHPKLKYLYVKLTDSIMNN